MQVKTESLPLPRPHTRPTHDAHTASNAAAATSPEASPGIAPGARPDPSDSGLGLSEQTRSELRALQRVQVQSNRYLQRFQSSRAQLESLFDPLVEMWSTALDARGQGVTGAERVGLDEQFSSLAEQVEAIHGETRFIPSGLLRFGDPSQFPEAGPVSGVAFPPPSADSILSGMQGAASFSLLSAASADAARRAIDDVYNAVSALSFAYRQAEIRLEDRIARAEAAIANTEAAASTLESFEEADRAAQLTRDQILDLQARSWVAQAPISAEKALSLLE